MRSLLPVLTIVRSCIGPAARCAGALSGAVCFGPASQDLCQRCSLPKVNEHHPFPLQYLRQHATLADLVCSATTEKVGTPVPQAQLKSQWLCGAGDEEYDAFAVRQGRRHRTPEEYQARLQLFRENQGKVAEMNTAGAPHQ